MGGPSEPGPESYGDRRAVPARPREAQAVRDITVAHETHRRSSQTFQKCMYGPGSYPATSLRRASSRK
jgi:hypothetical protein